MLLLIPALPLIGFLINAGVGRRLTKSISGAVAVLAIAGSFAVSVLAVAWLVALPPAERSLVQQVFSWISSGDFEVTSILILVAMLGAVVMARREPARATAEGARSTGGTGNGAGPMPPGAPPEWT